MGFLDFILGNKKEKETDALKAEIELLKTELLKNARSAKSDIDQIIAVLAEIDRDLAAIKEDAKYEDGENEELIGRISHIGFKNEKGMEELRSRMKSLEKIAANMKVVGKLSISNYDAIKEVNAKLKKLDKIDKIDAIEKTVREHISITPEAVVTKDEYSEEMKGLKKRLEMLERHEMFAGTEMEEGGILIHSERKRAKKK